MHIEGLTKTKITQIESLAESIKFSFGRKDEQLNNALSDLIELIKAEKDSRNQLRDIALSIVNKI